MPAAGLVVALLLAASTTCLAARDLQAAAQPAIVNGANAVKGRHRYMASLRTASGAHFCGGTLIHPQVVLTAAHCATIYSTANVRLGGYRRTLDAAGEYVERVTTTRVIHPGFVDTFAPAGTPNKDYLNNDVALFKLNTPVTTLPVLRLVGRKPKPGNPVPDGTNVMIVGWGAVNSQRTELAETLQMLAEKVLPLATCQAAWGTAVDWNGDALADPLNFQTNSMMCAARADYPNNLAGFCAGDSGGPLLVPGASAAADTQVGIVSWGADACGISAESPYVYTDVGMVFDWINTTVWQLTGQYLQNSSPSNGGSGSGTTTPPRPVVSGFNGARASFPGAANSGKYVVQYPGRWGLYGRLGAGPTPGSLLVNYYMWRWGTTVIARVNGATRALTVTVNGTTLAAGRTAAARNGTVRYAAVATNRARSLTIAETGVRVTLTQPWLVAEATWARWLNVAVTVTQRPAVKLTGLMGPSLDVTNVSGATSFAARSGSVTYTPLLRRRSLLEA